MIRNNYEIRKIATGYYYNLSIQYKFIPYLMNREFSMLTPNFYKKRDIEPINFRNMRVHNCQGFQYVIFKWFPIDRREAVFNLYYSIATFKDGLPMTSHNLKERKQHLDKWNKECYKEIIAYDLFIDIDMDTSEDIELARYTLTAVKTVLDAYNMPYQMRFSGNGFHIIVPYRVFKDLGYGFDPIDDNSIYKFFSDILFSLNDKYSEMIDTGISDHRRLCKLPYSLALYEDDIMLCRPLNTISEYRDFKIQNYKYENNQEKNLRNVIDIIWNDGKVPNVKGFLKEIGYKKRGKS